MDSWIEVSEKSLEQAIELAAGQLGVDADELDYEIVEESSSKGLFGLGQHRIRLRARVKPCCVESDASELADGDETMGAETGGAADMEGQSVSGAVMSMLDQIMEAAGFDVKPQIVSETSEEVLVSIEGNPEDIGKLIGRRGQTLDALQYLVGIAANKIAGTRTRILIDAGGYRARHQAALEQKAREIAEQVKLTGQEAVFEPQSARDRRIVHLALADDPDVYTYSEGEGDERHVVISPKH
jgi:spoIIIJ-associated protein